MSSPEIDLSLEPHPEAVATARRSLDGLTEVLPPERLENVRLLVSELLTNSARHAGLSPEDRIGFKLTLSPGMVNVEVTDSGIGFEPSDLPGADPDGGSGLGLPLVQRLSDRWGVERKHSNRPTRVWFEIGL